MSFTILHSFFNKTFYLTEIVHEEEQNSKGLSQWKGSKRQSKRTHHSRPESQCHRHETEWKQEGELKQLKVFTFSLVINFKSRKIIEWTYTNYSFLDLWNGWLRGRINSQVIEEDFERKRWWEFCGKEIEEKLEKI